MTERAQSRTRPRHRAQRRSRSRRFVLLAALLALCWLAYAQRVELLTAAGDFFVKVDDLEPAQIIVVLAGDGSGSRIMKAVDLVRRDFAPRILVTGPSGHYGRYECDLAIEFAVKHGAPKAIFDPFPMNVQSTKEEARVVTAELHRRGIRKAIVVTSNFHTARARRIFRRQGDDDTEYLFASAPNPYFSPDSWWKSRVGKKVFLLEALKTLNSWVEQDWFR